MASTAVRTVTTEVVTTATVAHLDTTLEEAIATFAQAKKDIKVLEAKKAQAEQKIREALGQATEGYINGVKRVSILSRTLSKINRKLLQEAYPEAYQASLEKTGYTVVDAE